MHVCLWLCVSLLLSPYSLWESCPARGGSGAERLMSTLTYGWVERCSDIASCGEASSQDKYFLVFNLYNDLFMNCFEHDECAE